MLTFQKQNGSCYIPALNKSTKLYNNRNNPIVKRFLKNTTKLLTESKMSQSAIKQGSRLNTYAITP